MEGKGGDLSYNFVRLSVLCVLSLGMEAILIIIIDNDEL